MLSQKVSGPVSGRKVSFFDHCRYITSLILSKDFSKDVWTWWTICVQGKGDVGELIWSCRDYRGVRWEKSTNQWQTLSYVSTHSHGPVLTRCGIINTLTRWGRKWRGGVLPAYFHWGIQWWIVIKDYLQSIKIQVFYYQVHAWLWCSLHQNVCLYLGPKSWEKAFLISFICTIKSTLVVGRGDNFDF